MKTLLQTRSDKSAMNFFSRIGRAAVLMLLASAPAAVAQIYDFTFTGSGGMDATGTISILSGVAQSGSINVTGVPLWADPSTLISAAGSLLPASGPTDAEDHDGDVITYDNVVNLANDPILDSDGLGFGSGQYDPPQGNALIIGSGQSDPSYYYNTLINLWGNSLGSYTLFVGEALLNPDGSVAVSEYVYHTDSGPLTLTLVPEPSTYALILGALTAGFVAIRRRRAAA